MLSIRSKKKMLMCAPICEEESSRDLRRKVGEGRAGCPWLG